MSANKGLHISKELILPTNAVTSTIVVYGGKGMGKTNFGAVLVEELAAAALRWSVLDPMGVWWGMRHSKDGKGNGVECLILGGAHGDIPIEPTGGAVIADLVADESANVIIDISRKANGEMWGIGERIRFATDYGRQLFKRQGSLINGRRREPICQVIDEAARYIPQMIRAGQPEVALCTSVWSTIVEEGRNVGLGVALLTQRSARLNKDVAELADLMLAFRTVGPNSIDAVMDWLGEHVPKADIRRMVETVRSLPVGSCLAVSPGWLQVEKVIHIRERRTFDSSATPKPGEKASKVQGAGAKPDLGVYAERMRETIERAKENSPTELKARIRELEKQLAKPAAPATTAVVVKPDPAVVKENAELRAALNRLKVSIPVRLIEALRNMTSTVEDVVRLCEIPSGPQIVPSKDEVKAAPISRAPVAKPTPINTVVRSASPANGKQLGGTALKIAQICAGYHGEPIKRSILAAMCGVSMGGSFSARLSEAKTAGAIAIEGTSISATTSGIVNYRGQFRAPETTDDVMAIWLPKLGNTGKAILEHLVQLGGRPTTRAALAEAVGMALGGSFSARLSEVRSTGLLAEPGSGQVAANAEALFL